jgi:uncharacterized protein (TIRG00374 family)
MESFLEKSFLESMETDNWKSLKQYLSWILFLGFVIWAFFYIRSHQEDFLVVSELSISSIIVLLSLAIIAFIISGLFTRILVKPYGVRLGHFEAFSISLVSLVGNYIMPFRGGMGLRAIYLKKKHALSYKQFTKVIAGRFVLVFFIESIFGLINLLLLWRLHGLFNPVFILILGSGFLLSSFALFAPLPNWEGPVLKRMNRLIRSVSETVKKNDKRRKLFLVTIANSIVRILIIYFAFESVGTILTIPQVVLISTLIPFSMIISVTPGNIGITEGVFLFASGFLGLSPAVALISATIVRLSFLSWSFLGIIFMKRWLKEPDREEGNHRES